MEPHQIDGLFAQTLVGDFDDESPWDAVRTLRGLGSRAVFDRAADWCSSGDPLKRARGASVLSQLGKTLEHPSNEFPEECFSVVSDLVQREKDPLPLLSAIHALKHIGNPLAIPLVVEHRLHPSADVRFAVACALGSFANEPLAVNTLLALTLDADEDVRDWATFGLGVLGDLDSKEIREALWRRMTDPNRNAREEALAGLGKRKDQRALPLLIAELSQPEISDCLIEAAEGFLSENDEQHRYGRDESRENWTAADYIAAIKRQFSF